MQVDRYPKRPGIKRAAALKLVNILYYFDKRVALVPPLSIGNFMQIYTISGYKCGSGICRQPLYGRNIALRHLSTNAASSAFICLCCSKFAPYMTCQISPIRKFTHFKAYNYKFPSFGQSNSCLYTITEKKPGPASLIALQAPSNILQKTTIITAVYGQSC